METVTMTVADHAFQVRFAIEGEHEGAFAEFDYEPLSHLYTIIEEIMWAHMNQISSIERTESEGKHVLRFYFHRVHVQQDIMSIAVGRLLKEAIHIYKQEAHPARMHAMAKTRSFLQPK